MRIQNNQSIQTVLLKWNDKIFYKIIWCSLFFDDSSLTTGGRANWWKQLVNSSAAN